jgi:hypothetical protein
VNEAFDDVIREYIDFVNRQVNVYIDVLAGFAGHLTHISAHKNQNFTNFILNCAPPRIKLQFIMVYCTWREHLGGFVD